VDVSPDDNPFNEPEPDLIVLNRDFTVYNANPRPEDLDLVVEISDSTLRFDLGVKAALYARAAIREYWVLDVAARRVIAHRNPASGQYTSVAVYGPDEVISPLAAPEACFRPSDVFPA
jgi:Uma2 family endonuclease